MAEEVKFAAAWEYRTMRFTVKYPAGWSGKLPRDQLEAAKAANVLEQQEESNGDEGAATSRPTRRSRTAEG